MGLIHEIQDLTRPQREAVLRLDPVLYMIQGSPPEVAAHMLRELRKISDLDTEQIVRILRGCAKDLFAHFSPTARTGLAFLDEADSLDQGNSAVQYAIAQGYASILFELCGAHLTRDERHHVLVQAIEDEDADEVCALLPYVIGDRSRLYCKELLAWTIAKGMLEASERIIEHIGREFTRSERYALARKLPIGDVAGEAELDFIAQYATKRDREACLLHRCQDQSANMEDIYEIASMLGLELRPKHLHILIDSMQDADERAKAAEALVEMRDTKANRALRDNMYAQARRHAIGNSSLARAEKYGQAIGMPLTPEELLAFIRRWTNSNANNAYHYRPLLTWARNLMHARLDNPNAPAPRLPVGYSA